MKDQMELTLEKAAANHAGIQRQRRMRRARWWFDQMRQVVDRALDRGPGGLASPEQICFPLQGEAQAD